ncbi:MAG: ATP-binding protein, partial [Isosphaeraceae bacterium]
MTDEELLIENINNNLDTGKVSEAKLATDDRVLARITDGIYRQPASALRELIANAYDADASDVYIQTDFPRFSRISVRDDGNGLTVKGLANLIHHIGGSPKRTKAGVGLGVVNKDDPSLSPGGRRLIGKIGIGLFSVAQLTRHFQIITKTKGSKHRLVAEVMLKTYTEGDLATLSKQDHVTFETGIVRIRAFPAEKRDAHGTEIILLDLRQQTKELLQSRDIWLRVDAGRDPTQMSEVRRPPTYHIGRMAPGSDEILSEPKSLPWGSTDPPDTRFAKLYQAIVEQVGVEESTPKLETLLDNYLRMLWTLSLSAPIDYINKHPFDLTASDDPSYYLIANTPRGQATK